MADAWRITRGTPAPDEVADRIAMSRGRRGGVYSYAPEELDAREGSEAYRHGLRWMWACPDCRISRTGFGTRAGARTDYRAHRSDRCGGEEPAWLERAREAYAARVDEQRLRRRGLHAPSKRAVDRLLADHGDEAAQARLDHVSDV